MENLLTFLENVKLWIEKGSPEMKRACVRAFGSNFFLDGKNVYWEPHPLLQDACAKRYNGLSVKYHEIELDKTLSRSVKETQLESVRASWSGIWDHNQTFSIKESIGFPDIAAMNCAKKVSAYLALAA